MFSSSKWRQLTRKPNHFGSVTRCQSRVYFVDCKGILTPILCTWIQESTLLLQNRGHAEVLKKTPSSAEYVTRVRPPSVPLGPPNPPPPPPPPPGSFLVHSQECNTSLARIMRPRTGKNQQESMVINNNATLTC